MRVAIRTEGLTKIYKRRKGKPVPALNGLSLEIGEGDTFGFIGPNGAGKTTTIKILVGLAFPSSGKAYLFDQPFSNPGARKQVGYLSETAAYSPYFEAEELLVALGRMSGMDAGDARKRSQELLNLVGLSDRRKSRLGEFSKGMLQRLGIAQALLHRPKILILDEPTSGLDPIAQRQVLDILRGLKGSGITIFFSSHRLVEVEGLCDYVGIVSLGNLIFHGTLQDLEMQESQTPYLVRFREPDGNLHEITIEKKALDPVLTRLHQGGAVVVSVLPQRSPLEDIFVKLVTQHAGGKWVS